MNRRRQTVVEYVYNDQPGGSVMSFSANVPHPVSEVKFEMVGCQYKTELNPDEAFFRSPIVVQTSLFPDTPILTVGTQRLSYYDNVANNYCLSTDLMTPNTFKFDQYQDVNGSFTVSTIQTLQTGMLKENADQARYFFRATFIGDVIKDAMNTPHKTVTYKTARLDFGINAGVPDTGLSFNLSCPHNVSRLVIKTSHNLQGEGVGGTDLFCLTSDLTDGQVFWTSAGIPSSIIDGANLYTYTSTPFQVTKEVIYNVPTRIDGTYNYQIVLPAVLLIDNYDVSIQVLFEMYE